MSEKMPMVPLGELAYFTMGQSPDSAHVNSDENGLPFLQGCAEFGAHYPSARVYCFPPLRVAQSGSTLISVRAPVGTMNRADQDYCIGRGLAAILAKQGVADDVFLLNAIEQNISYLHRRSQGSTFLAIGSADLNSMPVAAPELPVQQRIAEILSTVDEAIGQTEALIAKMQQIKAGLMHDLFTRGILPNGQLRPPREKAPQLYKDSPLGWIPREWKVVTIGDVLEIQLGKMLSKASKTGTCSAPYLGNRAVQWDRVDLSELEEMDFTPSERKKFALVHRDLLVCEGGDVGRTAMWHGEVSGCFFQKAIHRLRPSNGQVLPEYLLRYMRYFHDTGGFSLFTSQSSIAHLTREKLAVAPLRLPPMAEQLLLVDRFEAIDIAIEAEALEKKKLEAIKLSLMHDLLTGKVRVDVDCNSKAMAGSQHNTKKGVYP